MRAGFFSPVQLGMVKPPASRLPGCGACGLFKAGCYSPKIPVWGDGGRGVMIVSGVPGRDEDDRGRPLAGDAGEELKILLEAVGLNWKKDCWTTAAVICRPPDDRLKSDKTIDHCRPNLLNAIDTLKPSVIIPLGDLAVQSLLGHLWRPAPGGTRQWAGFRVPDQKLNAWVCPTWPPEAFLHKKLGQLVRRHTRHHLGQILPLLGTRPYPNGVPDRLARLRVVLDSDEAAKMIRRLHRAGGPVSFDLETNMLKPEDRRAEIVSCSFSDGATAFAFPWHGAAVPATFDILYDADIPKLGYNLKFEDRWVRRFGGKGVRGWRWDGMVASHVLDSRSKINSLKFQSYVMLGQPPYDEFIKPYLKGRGSNGNSPNRIRELPLHDLLVYNAMDSLLEYELAVLQAKVMGCSL